MEQESACAVRTKRKMAAALKELMQTTAFEKITVADIAELSNIHRQTFYYHFQDRYDLLDWLLYHELLVDFLDGLTFENMYDKFTKMFATMLADKKFYQSALTINASELTKYVDRVAREKFTDIIKNIAETVGVEKKSEASIAVTVDFFGYGITGIVLSWTARGMKDTPEEMTEYLRDLVTACRQLFRNK